MIFNQRTSIEYTLQKNPFFAYTFVPKPYKPSPTEEQYNRGYIERFIMIKNSNKTGHEINPVDATNLDNRIYTVYRFLWRISGEADFVKKNNIIIDYGVKNQNQKTLENIKKTENIDLSRIIKNPLDLWRGF
jgi:hypothetical protein